MLGVSAVLLAVQRLVGGRLLPQLQGEFRTVRPDPNLPACDSVVKSPISHSAVLHGSCKRRHQQMPPNRVLTDQRRTMNHVARYVGDAGWPEGSPRLWITTRTSAPHLIISLLPRPAGDSAADVRSAAAMGRLGAGAPLSRASCWQRRSWNRIDAHTLHLLARPCILV